MELDNRNLPSAFASADPFGDLSVAFDATTNEVDASATLRNPSGEGHMREVSLVINDEASATKTVSLQPGAKTEVSFTEEISDAGIFDVTIGDLDPQRIITPEISLAGEWRFHRGDDMAWKTTDYDDSGWEVVTLPENWEAHSNYEQNPAFGWYRKTFTVPEEWAGHALEIPVGKIDDVDEAFMNGEKIGQTGTFPTNGYETASPQTRRYIVPPEAIDFGGKNVIAMRVYDGGGSGGLYEGPLGPITVPESNET